MTHLSRVALCFTIIAFIQIVLLPKVADGDDDIDQLLGQPNGGDVKGVENCIEQAEKDYRIGIDFTRRTVFHYCTLNKSGLLYISPRKKYNNIYVKKGLLFYEVNIRFDNLDFEGRYIVTGIFGDVSIDNHPQGASKNRNYFMQPIQRLVFPDEDIKITIQVPIDNLDIVEKMKDIGFPYISFQFMGIQLSDKLYGFYQEAKKEELIRSQNGQDWSLW